MTQNKTYKLVVIGAGAAGVFAAIHATKALESGTVLILEKSLHPLLKVKISGGGRCNVTHACFNPAQLVHNYPRGSKELRGPFSYFQPLNTIEWFQEHGVVLKTEEDGRMFPVTDNSQTIIDCLLKAANDVEIQYGKNVVSVRKNEKFIIEIKNGEKIEADSLMLATGSSAAGYALAQSLGHTIVEPIPSLFTFNIPSCALSHLSGISVEKTAVSLPEFGYKQKGPLLITHWGFSGPAVLKLSAYAARELHGCNYSTQCLIDWLPDVETEMLRKEILKTKQAHPTKYVTNEPHALLPRQLWKTFVELCSIAEETRWGHLSKEQMEKLIQKIKGDSYLIEGKTTYKQEFVTCGGVRLSEVNFKTMESKLVGGLYFGGEILDVDGITGGFNFQAAWTTGYLAGKAVGSNSSSVFYRREAEK